MNQLKQMTVEYVKKNPVDQMELINAVNNIIQAEADYNKANNYAEMAKLNYEKNKDFKLLKTFSDNATANYKLAEESLMTSCDLLYDIANNLDINLRENYKNYKELAKEVVSYYAAKNPLVELYADINKDDPEIFEKDEELLNSLLELSTTRPDIVTNKDFPDNLKEPTVLALAYASAIQKAGLYKNTETIEYLRQNTDKINLEVAIKRSPEVMIDINDTNHLESIKESNPNLFNRLCYLAYEGYSHVDENKAEKILSLIPDDKLIEFANIQHAEDNSYTSYEFDENGNEINDPEEEIDII